MIFYVFDVSFRYFFNVCRFENLTYQTTEENALWIADHYDSLWFLINQTSSMCLVFNTKEKLIYRLEENSTKIKESSEVQVDDHLWL